MRTAFIFLNLWALHCTVSSSPPSPTNVAFSSVNLRNLLLWSPGNGTPNDTLYTVHYAIYGDRVDGNKRVNWRSVRHCKEVVRQWCDLSNETWDLEHGYFARVRAVSRSGSSKWSTTSKRFDPKSDTIFGPPLVSVDMEDNKATITIKGPMRYQPNNQISSISMNTLYDMKYNLTIHNLGQDRMSHFELSSTEASFKYRLLEYDTEYCFSAKTKFHAMPVHCQSSEWYCITTDPDPWIAQLRSVVIGIVVPSAFLCLMVVIGYFLYRYLTGEGQKSPYILNPPSFHPPPLTFFPEKTLSVVHIQVGSPLPPVNPLNSGSGKKTGYAPQRIEARLDPDGPCDDSSIEYGFVGQASESDVWGEGEEKERGHDEVNRSNPEINPNNPYAPQGKSCLLQKSASSCSETHMQRHTHTEVSTHVQACAFLPMSPVLQHQNQAALLAPQGPNVKSKTEEMVIARTQAKLDEEKEESERAPLLSAYACQGIMNMPTSQSDQSDGIPDDYGVLSSATPYTTEEDEGTISLDWDPETGKLVLPEMEWIMKDGLMQEEEEEELGVKMGRLTLKSVYVRQGSEERAEVMREMEEGGDTVWEPDELQSRWSLKISMDE